MPIIQLNNWRRARWLGIVSLCGAADYSGQRRRKVVSTDNTALLRCESYGRAAPSRDFGVMLTESRYRLLLHASNGVFTPPGLPGAFFRTRRALGRPVLDRSEDIAPAEIHSVMPQNVVRGGYVGIKIVHRKAEQVAHSFELNRSAADGQ